MIVNLTCQTDKCPSKGIAVPVEDPADFCMCGACEQEITDKQPE